MLYLPITGVGGPSFINTPETIERNVQQERFKGSARLAPTRQVCRDALLRPMRISWTYLDKVESLRGEPTGLCKCLKAAWIKRMLRP